MGYHDEEDRVRVDIWKGSGKWYTTVSLKWDRYTTKSVMDGSIELIHETFRRCMSVQYGGYSGTIATCLEPYHESEHPLMIKL